MKIRPKEYVSFNSLNSLNFLLIYTLLYLSHFIGIVMCTGVNYLDNNNCAPSFLSSLCEIRGDCYGPRYFSEGA